MEPVNPEEQARQMERQVDFEKRKALFSAGLDSLVKTHEVGLVLAFAAQNFRQIGADLFFDRITPQIQTVDMKEVERLNKEKLDKAEKHNEKAKDKKKK